MKSKYLAPLFGAALAVVLVVVLADAQPAPGFSKTAPIAGTGSNGSPLRITGCATNEILKWNGTAWACASDAGGGTYTAGNGLTESPANTFNVGCSTGLSCGADTVTLNMAGASCSAGTQMSALSATGTGTCSADVTAVANGTGISTSTVSGTATITANLAGASCSAGSFMSALSATGTGTCTAETGDIAGITTAAPLSGGCTTGTCALTTSVATNTFAGRITAGTGVIEALTPTQATSMLDTFSTSGTTKGLVPGSNGATTSCLKGDGTWGGCNVIAVQTDSSTSTLNDFPLGASTTMLVFTSSSSASINGMTGGTDGRCVDLIYLGVGTLSFNNEQSGSTAANRFVTANTASWPTSPNSQTRTCYVGGTTNRWTISRDHRMSSLTTAGSINAGTSINASTTMSSAGGATLGDATTDSHTVNGTLSQFAGAGYHLIRGASTAQSVLQLDSNGTGMLSATANGADDNAIGFDLEKFNNVWTAHDTSVAGITKRGDKLNVGCINGTSNGTDVTTAWSTAYDDCGTVDLATQVWTVPALSSPGTIQSTGTGDLASADDLTVVDTTLLNGNTSLGDAAADVISLNGTLHDNKGAPALTSCGTTPSVIGGSNAFTFTSGTGSPVSCTAALSGFTTTPSCTATPHYNAFAGSYQPWISAVSPTSVTITFSSSGISGAVISVHCIGT